jgi:hypothetical protein
VAATPEQRQATEALIHIRHVGNMYAGALDPPGRLLAGSALVGPAGDRLSEALIDRYRTMRSAISTAFDQAKHMAGPEGLGAADRTSAPLIENGDQTMTLNVTDFQLYLLRTMHYAPGLVQDALAGLGKDHAQMEKAYQAVHEATLGTRPYFDELPTILGQPVAQGRRQVGRTERRTSSFQLPLWEELLFEVTEWEQGFVSEERFVRPPHALASSLRSAGDLVPWAVTKGEVSSAFGPLEPGDLWPPFEEYRFNLASPDGISQTVEVIFSWGLLQQVSIENFDPQ